MEGEKENDKEMGDLGKQEENLQENAVEQAVVNEEEDGGSESPMMQPSSVSNKDCLKEENDKDAVGNAKSDCPETKLSPEDQKDDEAAGGGSLGVTAEEKKMSNEEISGKGGLKPGHQAENRAETSSAGQISSWETQYEYGEESGTEEEQCAFRREVENFYKERNFEFRAPKFYKEDLNMLKLYRAVIKLGGYEQVTSCKLWRQVGAPFRPPKTCTTVSWTFRNFYEKSLIEYEKQRMRSGKLPFNGDSYAEPKVESQVGVSISSGSGRTMRDAAARAMHVWNSPRIVDDEDGKPSLSTKTDKHQKSIGTVKRKKPSPPNFVEHAAPDPCIKSTKPQRNAVILDVGPPADWVKINVYKISDCFEVYALVPGLLREEVRVQSDPSGRLIISGQPQQLDNPWGVTPFKKVVSLPSRIDPHQTSAVVTLNGQLFVRVPFEQTES
ncbi:hypothetical protein SAY86_013993 [Trapa natans]|uniref:Uncharacterized protein n=1 Tax=Trapa natans TaxID=22666 RepID=A0AAN7QQE0_TRANT|nr:hypothetical protein SAY86_013993 [Trapa natans]